MLWLEVFRNPLLPNNDPTTSINCWWILFVGAMMGYSLFPREHDEKTIEFLYSLPISRARIFAVKFGTAALLVMIVVLYSAGVDWVAGLSTVDSLGAADPTPTASPTVMLLEAALGLIGLCHGCLL